MDFIFGGSGGCDEIELSIPTSVSNNSSKSILLDFVSKTNDIDEYPIEISQNITDIHELIKVRYDDLIGDKIILTNDNKIEENTKFNDLVYSGQVD